MLSKTKHSKQTLASAIVYLQKTSLGRIYGKIDSLDGAGGHYREFTVQSRFRLSDFNKQIQEKPIHERTNLSNLFTAHSACPGTTHTIAHIGICNRRLQSYDGRLQPAHRIYTDEEFVYNCSDMLTTSVYKWHR